MSWYQIDQDKRVITLSVHIQPKAKTMEVVGLYGDALKIRLNTPPVDGKANKVLLRFLASCFSVPLSSIELLSGQSSRQKRVKIEGIVSLPACFSEFI